MSTPQRLLDLLSAGSISKYIALSLPRDAEPQLQVGTDAIAVACHAGMLAVGFRLIGLGEEYRSEIKSNESQAQPLPPQWRENASTIAFRYAHSQSAMEYLLKINKLGPKTLIHGIALGDDKTTTFDINTKDFVSDPCLPASPTRDPTKNEDDVLHDIQSIYITPSRLTELGSLLKLNIIQKLIPSLQKPGYKESELSSTSANTSQDATQSRSANRQPHSDSPVRDDPRLPGPALPQPPFGDPEFRPRRPVPDFAPPGFEDELELQRPMRGGMPRHPGGPLADYGEADLHPPGLGGHDPLRIGPRGGGMHPNLGRFDEGHNPSFDMQRPPGSRWDPVNGEPWDPSESHFGPGLGNRGPGTFGGPGNPFSRFGGGDFI